MIAGQLLGVSFLKIGLIEKRKVKEYKKLLQMMKPQLSKRIMMTHLYTMQIRILLRKQMARGDCFIVRLPIENDLHKQKAGNSRSFC